MLKAKTRFSLLVPIGHFSFFAISSLFNIVRTCGRFQDVDFVFLTDNNPPEYLKQTFEDLSKQYKFRVFQAPFETTLHLDLLDWAFYNVDLCPWVIIQHCDLFWDQCNWLNTISDIIIANPKCEVVRERGPERYFYYDGVEVPSMHDYLGVYKRNAITSKGLKFRWGRVGSEVKLSTPVMDAIESQRLIWRVIWRSHIHQKPIVPIHDFMDGTEAISLEYFVNWPELVCDFHVPHHHLWGFFRHGAHCTKLVGKELHIDHDVSWFFGYQFHEFVQYSWFASFLMERHEVSDRILPWSILMELSDLYTTKEDMKQRRKNYEELYIWKLGFNQILPKNPVNLDDLEIEQIVFRDKTFPRQKLKQYKFTREQGLFVYPKLLY